LHLKPLFSSEILLKKRSVLYHIHSEPFENVYSSGSLAHQPFHAVLRRTKSKGRPSSPTIEDKRRSQILMSQLSLLWRNFHSEVYRNSRVLQQISNVTYAS